MRAKTFDRYCTYILRPTGFAGIGVSTHLFCGHGELNPPVLRAWGAQPTCFAGMGSQPTGIAGEGEFTPPKTVHTPKNSWAIEGHMSIENT